MDKCIPLCRSFMHRLIESHFVDASDEPPPKIQRPFYVVVSQPFLSNAPNVLDLHDGDIFICTFYNKVGHWWGISVYDLQRQGWFPSTLVQPYAGDVPDDAAIFVEKIKSTAVTNEEKIPDYNIVTDDDHKYTEYEVSGAVQRVGRRTRIGENPLASDEPDDDVDFDYETWAAQKNADSDIATAKKARNSYR